VTAPALLANATPTLLAKVTAAALLAKVTATMLLAAPL